MGNGNGTRIRAANRAYEGVIQRQGDLLSQAPEPPTTLEQKCTFQQVITLYPRRDGGAEEIEGGIEALDQFYMSNDDQAVARCVKYSHNLRMKNGFIITSRTFGVHDAAPSSRVYIAGVPDSMDAKIRSLSYYATNPKLRKLNGVQMPFLGDRTSVCVYHDPSETAHEREICLVVGTDRSLVGRCFQILAAR